MKLEKIINEALTTNRDLLLELKNSAVNHKEYELGAMLRDMEKKHFPVKSTDNKKYSEGENFRVACGMAEINTSPKMSYVILNLARAYDRKKNQLSLKDTVKITTEANRIFGGE